MSKLQIRNHWDPGEISREPVATFRICNMVVQKVENAPLAACRLHRFMYGQVIVTGIGKKAIAFKGFIESEFGIYG